MGRHSSWDRNQRPIPAPGRSKSVCALFPPSVSQLRKVITGLAGWIPSRCAVKTISFYVGVLAGKELAPDTSADIRLSANGATSTASSFPAQRFPIFAGAIDRHPRVMVENDRLVGR